MKSAYVQQLKTLQGHFHVNLFELSLHSKETPLGEQIAGGVRRLFLSFPGIVSAGDVPVSAVTAP